MAIEVYLETGTKRVFAGAIEWPGWCRGARDADGALQALDDHRARYADALASSGVKGPPRTTPLAVAERLRGNTTTDFGAPSIAPKADARPLDDRELDRLLAILHACWAAFDAAAKGARGRSLSVGPRGGGRDVAKMTDHVLEADRAYLGGIGGRSPKAEVRVVFVQTLTDRAHGVPPTENPRRKTPFWTPRYAIRRSAWHALDHAWEIENRLS